MPATIRAENRGDRVGWRALPWLAAATEFGLLAAAALDDGFWRRAHQLFPWMLRPMFHDWQVVRYGLQAWTQGVDPLAAPDHPFNYPRILLLGSHVGLQDLPLTLAGLTAAALLLGSLAFFLARSGPIAAVIGAALLLSPPVLLLLERGNLDAWIVILLLWGLFALSRARFSGACAAGAAAVLLASLLKLYPAVVAAGGAVVWSDARRKWLGMSLVALVAMFVWNRDELRLIFQKTGRGLEPGYGWAIAGSRHFLDAAQRAAPETVRHRSWVMHGSLALYGTLLATAGVAGWRGRHRLAGRVGDPWVRSCFWSGALIYAGTFGLGANWSYRLVFLLFCVPGLGEALEVSETRLWDWGGVALVAATLFAPFHAAIGWFYLWQAAQWLLAALLFGGAVAVTAAGRAADPVHVTRRQPERA